MTIHNAPLDKETGNRDTAKGGDQWQNRKASRYRSFRKVWGRERLPRAFIRYPLAAFAQAHIEEAAVISSDAYSSYLKVFSSGKYPHEPKRFTKADKDHLKWLHVFVSNAKTFILGTY
ncbi:MAG: hypothetical protein LBC72_04265, partial [Spirochaetaceae bacterium]|nr:hypothetical protein [Spirochaetaceae bacterium]